MIKRILALVMICAFALSMIAGCAGKPTDAKKPAEAASEEEPYNIIFAFMGGRTLPAEHCERVSKLLSEYTMEKIGCTVTLMPLSAADWRQKMPLMLATPDEKLDVMAALYSMYPGYLAQNQLQDIAPYVSEVFPEYEEMFGSPMLNCSKKGEALYGLACVTATGTSRGLKFNKALVDELGIDITSVHSMADLTPLFAKVKEAHPELYPYGIDGVSISALWAFDEYDPLDNHIGALLNCTTNTTVINPYASDEFYQYCKLAHEWYEAGYVSPDCLTGEHFVEYDVQDGKSFCALTANNAITTANEAELRGAYYRRLFTPVQVTAQMAFVRLAVPVNCKNPEKAVEFMKLMFTDETVMNYVCWGEKDVDYIITENGRAAVPEGKTAGVDTYTYGASMLVGSEYIGLLYGSYPDGYADKLKAFNESANVSMAAGFSFDSTPVAAQVSAIANVTSEYVGALQCGLVDPDVVLPEFLAKLEAAGINEVIAEKQSQLDAWLAAK